MTALKNCAFGDGIPVATPDTADTERTMNALLHDQLRCIDSYEHEDERQIVAQKLERRLNSNLHMAEVEGMRVQIQLQPARARLVKVDL